jgi:hypothetical protein
MEKAVQSPAEVLSPGGPAKDESGLFSIESVLKLQKLIFAGSPLLEVLTNIAELVESQATFFRSSGLATWMARQSHNASR